MSLIKIKNIDEDPVRRYGEEFKPGETIEIPTDTIIAYSLMELSLSAKRINDKLGKIVHMDSVEHIHTITDRNFGKSQNIYIQNLPDNDPWLVRKYKEYKKRKEWNKIHEKRRTMEAKP